MNQELRIKNTPNSLKNKDEVKKIKHNYLEG